MVPALPLSYVVLKHLVMFYSLNQGIVHKYVFIGIKIILLKYPCSLGPLELGLHVYAIVFIVSVLKLILWVPVRIRTAFFCICENKDAVQLRGNREADQRLCFRYCT